MKEIELKFRVDSFDEIEKKLSSSLETAHVMTDVYYRHPTRDFLATDEWLRIRTCSRTRLQRDQHCANDYRSITYKGPKNGASRTETEISTIHDPSLLLELLGFKPFLGVIKTRREAKIWLRDIKNYLTVCLDVVEGLGNYVELEILNDNESESSVIMSHLCEWAEQLNLVDEEKLGYAQLMLQKNLHMIS